MSVHKRKRKGKITWLYKFDGPGSTRDNRRIVRGFGFATKSAAQDAEAKRRIDEEQKFAMAKAGVGVVAEVLAWVYRVNRYRYYAEQNQT